MKFTPFIHYSQLSVRKEFKVKWGNLLKARKKRVIKLELVSVSTFDIH